MFIRLEEIRLEHTRNTRHVTKKTIICACDLCGKEFTKKYTSKLLEKAKKNLAFCSRSCLNESRKKGGALQKQITSNRDNNNWAKKVKETIRKRHGVDNAGQMSDHVDKCSKTISEKYGEEYTNALQLPETRRACLDTLQNPKTAEKRKETCRTKWGHENVFGSKSIKDKIRETLLTKYGVDHASKIEGLAKKRSDQLIAKYGCHPFLRKSSKDKARITCLTRYGTEIFWGSTSHKVMCRSAENRRRISEMMKSIAKTTDFNKKRHETMKRNGTYGKSKAEDILYEELLRSFSNVIRQVDINGWAIDFYIPTIDTYVQFDGTYWHGLDRQKVVLESSTSPRDKAILETMARDEMQNEWFRENGKKLARFTDLDSIDYIVCQLLKKS